MNKKTKCILGAIIMLILSFISAYNGSHTDLMGLQIWWSMFSMLSGGGGFVMFAFSQIEL